MFRCKINNIDCEVLNNVRAGGGMSGDDVSGDGDVGAMWLGVCYHMSSQVLYNVALAGRVFCQFSHLIT